MDTAIVTARQAAQGLALHGLRGPLKGDSAAAATPASHGVGAQAVLADWGHQVASVGHGVLCEVHEAVIGRRGVGR
eukprot:6306797-Alexandrium_andersonii.AAC.1